MKFVEVNEIPMEKRGWHPLQDMIEEFVNSDIKIVKVDFDERDYKSLKTCDNSFRVAVKRSGHRVKVMQRNGELYLKKV